MRWLWVSCVFGALAVAFGAFGAHALKSRLSADMLAVYSTATQYHLVHAIVLFAVALYSRATGTPITLPASLFLAGIVLFSGSLYLLAITGNRALGMITPLGGLCFIAGWLTSGWSLSQR